MSTNSWVDTLLWTTWSKSFIMQCLHWDVGQNSCRLSHFSFPGGHRSILTKDIFGVIECAKLQSLGLLREWLLLNLRIVVLDFLFYQLLFVSKYIVFFVGNLPSKESQFSDLSFFHGYGCEVSEPHLDIAFFVPIVLFFLILFKRHVFVIGMVKLFSGVLCWLEIEIVTSYFKAIFLDGTQSSRRPLLVEIPNAQVGLSGEIHAVILALFFALGIEISRPNNWSTILVFVGSFRWKLIGLSDSYGNWLREKTKTGSKIKRSPKGSTLT
jgi:hypothetical protein